MFPRIAVVTACCVALAAVATIAFQAHTNAELKQQTATLALGRTNAVAALAQTVNVSATNQKLAKMMGDSLRMVQKAVVQVRQKKDSIDEALQLERVGSYALGVRLDSLQRRASAVVVSDTGDHVRHASFDVRQAPYTVAIAVDLPAAPDTAHLDLRVALDPIPVKARLSCAAPDEYGIRTASIEAQAPKWASIRFEDLQQSADLCASPALTHATGRSFVKFKPLMIGGGRVVLPDGTSRWGGFVGSGFAFGGS